MNFGEGFVIFRRTSSAAGRILVRPGLGREGRNSGREEEEEEVVEAEEEEKSGSAGA